MSKTDDDVTHLRALLAEWRARAERAETRLNHAVVVSDMRSAERDRAEACNEAMREPMAALRAAVGMPAEGEGAVVAKVLSERDAALAACADMRVTCRTLLAMVGGDPTDSLILSVEQARAALATPAPGAGCVVLTREEAERAAVLVDQGGMDGDDELAQRLRGKVTT